MAQDDELKRRLEEAERKQQELAWRQKQAEEERTRREQAEQAQQIKEEREKIEKGGGTDSTRP